MPNEIKLTADFILWERRIYLIKRKYSPFEGCWALPGGHVDERETFYDAAMRELKEETNGEPLNCKYIDTLDSPNRDPRGRYISVVYCGENSEREPIQAMDDAVEVQAFTYGEIFDMYSRGLVAFDHFEVIKTFFEQTT